MAGITIREALAALRFFDARLLLGPPPAPAGKAEKARDHEQPGARLRDHREAESNRILRLL
jgi:hypothetical protein